ncbi:hypothetical protein BACFIN_07405 [Bacteroides finegoldii DSM 17565]|nr:hypothetical protein BACFIN_07405 [Bacteroides finegoldii DSM 17565]
MRHESRGKRLWRKGKGGNGERVATGWHEVACRQERMTFRYKNFKIKSVPSQQET